MDGRRTMMQTEPAIIIGSVTAFITALVPLLAVTFGWTEQVEALWAGVLLAGWTVIASLVGIVIIRSRVYSPATHEAEVEAASTASEPS